VRIRPAARDELPVPAQKRRRRDEERSPPCLPRQDAAQRRQQRPISLRQRGSGDLTLQHTKLVAQQQDLDLLLPLRPTPKRNQLEQPAQRPVRERENHAPRTTRHGIPAYPSPDPPAQAITQEPRIRIIGTYRFRDYRARTRRWPKRPLRVRATRLRPLARNDPRTNRLLLSAQVGRASPAARLSSRSGRGRAGDGAGTRCGRHGGAHARCARADRTPAQSRRALNLFFRSETSIIKQDVRDAQSATANGVHYGVKSVSCKRATAIPSSPSYYPTMFANPEHHTMHFYDCHVTYRNGTQEPWCEARKSTTSPHRRFGQSTSAGASTSCSATTEAMPRTAACSASSRDGRSLRGSSSSCGHSAGSVCLHTTRA
jgi:hypothetical protein